MGIFGFLKRNTIEDIIDEFIGDLFKIYDVKSPTDAEKFRARMYTFVIVNTLIELFDPSEGKVFSEDARNRIAVHTGSTVKYYRFNAGDAVLEEAKYQNFLSALDPSLKAVTTTPIDAQAAISSFMDTQAEHLRKDLFSCDAESLFGYSNVKLVGSTFGAKKAKSNYLEFEELYMNFIQNLTKSIFEK